MRECINNINIGSECKMSKLLLSIIIACSLGLTGCTEEDKQSTGNKALDDALGIKTEEKVKEPESKESTKEDKKKTDTKTKKSEDTKESKKDPQTESEEEMIKRVNARDIVLGPCDKCDRIIRRSELGYDDVDRIICKDCYNKGYTKCMDCGKTINEYDKGVDAGSSGLRCKDCIEAYINNIGNDTYHCSKCGTEVEIGNSQSSTYDDNGNLLCLNCYFNEHDQIGDAPE